MVSHGAGPWSSNAGRLVVMFVGFWRWLGIGARAVAPKENDKCVAQSRIKDHSKGIEA